MLTTLVLVIHSILALALVGVILLQRSEGGALGVGGGPTGLMTARGAANLLTRATAILATAFIVTSIILAVLAGYNRGTREIDTTLAPATAPAAPTVPLAGEALPAGPATGEGGILPPATDVPADQAAPTLPTTPPSEGDVPLAQ